MPEHANSTKRFGDFEIVCELGCGGMGIVYEARQVSLNRRVAFKVISGTLGLTRSSGPGCCLGHSDRVAD